LASLSLHACRLHAPSANALATASSSASTITSIDAIASGAAAAAGAGAGATGGGGSGGEGGGGGDWPKHWLTPHRPGNLKISECTLFSGSSLDSQDTFVRPVQQLISDEREHISKRRRSVRPVQQVISDLGSAPLVAFERFSSRVAPLALPYIASLRSYEAWLACSVAAYERLAREWDSLDFRSRVEAAMSRSLGSLP